MGLRLAKKMFCILSILLIQRLCVYGQAINDIYEFPIKAGTEEWKQFESIEKRVTALQMPDTVLAIISTEGLLETCLTLSARYII